MSGSFQPPGRAYPLRTCSQHPIKTRVALRLLPRSLGWHCKQTATCCSPRQFSNCCRESSRAVRTNCSSHKARSRSGGPWHSKHHASSRTDKDVRGRCGRREDSSRLAAAPASIERHNTQPLPTCNALHAPPRTLAGGLALRSSCLLSVSNQCRLPG